MRIFLVLFLFTLISHPLHAFDLRDLIRKAIDFPLDSTEQQLYDTFPSLDFDKKSMDPIPGSQVAVQSTFYTAALQDATPFTFLMAAKNDETFRLSLNTGNMMSSGWEGADLVMRGGEDVYKIIEVYLGDPLAHSLSMREKQNYSIFWMHQEKVVHYFVTHPETIMKDTGFDHNPRGYCIITVASQESMDKELETAKRAGEKISPQDVDLHADYEAFLKKLHVEELPETANLLPQDFQDLHLGMSTKTLQTKRPKVRADDFFNERERFYEHTEHPLFPYLTFDARMDRVVRIQLDIDGGSFTFKQADEIFKWCSRHWGEPDGWSMKEDLNAEYPYSRHYFVWNFDNATGVLKVSTHRFYRASLLLAEKKLPINNAIGIREDINLVEGERVKEKWEEIKKIDWIADEQKN